MKILQSSVSLMACMMFFFLQLSHAASKPSPDEALELLVQGNTRFTQGKSIHPNTGPNRLYQAGTENQGDHAYATVITCSDSRVPVERIFDAGVMDIFVIRVAGNVMDTDEAGSIEYGLAHVNTPVLVVLGHTQCGAVTAVTHAVHGEGHALELNIPPLVDNITPAVERAIAAHPDVQGDDIIPHAIVENVWQGIEDLFMKSPASRNLVKDGKVKVVGAIYDVGTARINWLPEKNVAELLTKVEANPERAMNAMAEEGHTKQSAHGDSGGEAQQHGEEARKDIATVPVTLAEDTTKEKLSTNWLNQSAEEATEAHVGSGFSKTFWLIIAILVCFGLVIIGSLASGIFKRILLRPKLYASFGSIIFLATILGAGAFLNLRQVGGFSHLEVQFLEMEVLAGEIITAQNNFLLHGIEDKEYGEQQIERVGEATALLLENLQAVEASSYLAQEQLPEIKALRTEIEQYTGKFSEVAAAYHEIEEGKETFDTIHEQFEHTLTTMIEHHEGTLATANADGDLSQVAAQATIIEHLMEFEMHMLQTSYGVAEFLLDKNVDHIAAMERELGLSKGYLQVVEEEISNQEELQQLETLREAQVEFESALVKVIHDEAVIEEDTAMMNGLLGQFVSSNKQLSLLSEMQSKSTASEANLSIILLNMIMLVVGILFAFFLTRSITGPILQGVNFARAVADGDLTGKLDIQQKDETGMLARALNTMTESLNTMMKDITKGATELASSSRLLSETSNQMSANAEETSGQSGTVATAAEEMSSNMNNVAAASEEASTNVSLVASAAEEMSSTIAEIASNTAKTSSLTSQAVDQASKASQKVNELGGAAQEISKVTETITEISEQTNLLALNATIEAARAGEAGKGFAVVANEIKELAKQTADATLEIKDKIEGVQNSTQGTVVEIADITKIIGDVNSMANTIAAAIEEQSAATQEISSNVSQASLGIQEVNVNVTESSNVARDIAEEVAGIDHTASELSKSSAEVLSSSDELNAFSERLNEMVKKFKLAKG